ncbi:hypothetical protein [Microbacterium sp. CIAB417]|nr:hypothetical protein [Microbacterium sp. CIAB417]
MSDPQTSDATPAAKPLVAPGGLDLLGDADAGSCSGGFCALPTE